jgi:hypothetical protein
MVSLGFCVGKYSPLKCQAQLNKIEKEERTEFEKEPKEEKTEN